MSTKRRIAVLLPAFNEAPGLERLVWRIARALDGLDYLIVIVDDGSTDGTAEIAEGLSRQLPVEIVRHEQNSGYGAAIRTGLLHARRLAEVVVTMDADDSHDPSLIPLMLHGVACGSDVIVASRFVPGGREVGVPFHRRILSHGAAFVFSRLLHVDGIRDYTSGYRAYRSQFLNELVELLGEEGLVRETGFTVGVELLLKADRVGGRLAEVPLVLRYDRKRSASKLKIGETLSDYAELIPRAREETVRPPPSSPDGADARTGLGYGVLATMATDVAAVFVAFLLSFGLYWTTIRLGLVSSGYPDPLWYAGLAGILALTTVGTFWRFGLYAPRLSVLHLGHLQLVSEAFTVSVAIFFAVLFLGALNHPSRLLVVTAIFTAYPVMLISRGAMTGWLRTRRMSSSDVKRVLIYGAGATGRLVAKKIIEAPRLGSEVVGFLDDREPAGSVVDLNREQNGTASGRLEILGGRRDLARTASETGTVELLVAIPDLGAERLAALRAEAEAIGLDLAIVPRIGSVRPDQLKVEDLGAIPVLRMYRDEPKPGYELAKRAMDILLVFLLSPVALPLFVLTGAVVAMEGRPVLFRQTRIGRYGRPFTVWKFRTMHPAVDPYAASPEEDDDARITRIGRLVRTAGLDELPQLLNVLRGEMSLVGPRPEMPHIVAGYNELQRQRLSVRPGISGLWQLSRDRSSAIHENLEYDLYYLRQQKLSFDLLIAGETALFMIKALARTFVAAVRDVSWDVLRLGAGGFEAEEREYVLVALDQRRRPLEPPSWNRCLPEAATLARDCPVKLVVAKKNSSRIRQLTTVNAEPAGPAHLEYVTYHERDQINALAGRAEVVVTDLAHLADWAQSHGVSVLRLDHEGADHRSAGPSAGLSDRVRAAFGQRELRCSQ